MIATLASGGPASGQGSGFRIVRQRHKQGIFNYETQTIDRNVADLILSVNGEKVLTADDFLSAIEAHQPGDEVTEPCFARGTRSRLVLRLGTFE